MESSRSEEGFLRAILAAPEDSALRLVYADWLEERGDPRADFLRRNQGFARLSFVDWLEEGSLDYYADQFPEIRPQVEERRETAHLNSRRRAALASFDPKWLAFMDTLGQAFRPFFFWNNAQPESFGPGELPFKEAIGTRGALVTFESSFRNEHAWDSGLMFDLRFLRRLRLGDCYYGAASCPVHPFICELKSRGPVTGAVVLEALKARDFQSEHIRDLNVTHIPFPGYHPHTDNDEIHNDLAGQKIFLRPGDEEPGEGEEEGAEQDPTRSLDAYRALKRYVEDERLWYVLLHGAPFEVFEGTELYNYVVLFAVGRSGGDRLLGVVTHQVCHNLCD